MLQFMFEPKKLSLLKRLTNKVKRLGSTMFMIYDVVCHKRTRRFINIWSNKTISGDSE